MEPPRPATALQTPTKRDPVSHGTTRELNFTFLSIRHVVKPRPPRKEHVHNR